MKWDYASEMPKFLLRGSPPPGNIFDMIMPVDKPCAMRLPVGCYKLEAVDPCVRKIAGSYVAQVLADKTTEVRIAVPEGSVLGIVKILPAQGLVPIDVGLALEQGGVVVWELAMGNAQRKSVLLPQGAWLLHATANLCRDLMQPLICENGLGPVEIALQFEWVK